MTTAPGKSIPFTPRENVNIDSLEEAEDETRTRVRYLVKLHRSPAGKNPKNPITNEQREAVWWIKKSYFEWKQWRHDIAAVLNEEGYAEIAVWLIKRAAHVRCSDDEGVYRLSRNLFSSIANFSDFQPFGVSLAKSGAIGYMLGFLSNECRSVRPLRESLVGKVRVEEHQYNADNFLRKSALQLLLNLLKTRRFINDYVNQGAMTIFPTLMNTSDEEVKCLAALCYLSLLNKRTPTDTYQDNKSVSLVFIKAITAWLDSEGSREVRVSIEAIEALVDGLCHLSDNELNIPKMLYNGIITVICRLSGVPNSSIRHRSVNLLIAVLTNASKTGSDIEVTPTEETALANNLRTIAGYYPKAATASQLFDAVRSKNRTKSLHRGQTKEVSGVASEGKQRTTVVRPGTYKITEKEAIPNHTDTTLKDTNGSITAMTEVQPCSTTTEHRTVSPVEAESENKALDDQQDVIVVPSESSERPVTTSGENAVSLLQLQPVPEVITTNTESERAVETMKASPVPHQTKPVVDITVIDQHSQAVMTSEKFDDSNAAAATVTTGHSEITEHRVSSPVRTQPEYDGNLISVPLTTNENIFPLSARAQAEFDPLTPTNAILSEEKAEIVDEQKVHASHTEEINQDAAPDILPTAPQQSPQPSPPPPPALPVIEIQRPSPDEQQPPIVDDFGPDEDVILRENEEIHSLPDALAETQHRLKFLAKNARLQPSDMISPESLRAFQLLATSIIAPNWQKWHPDIAKVVCHERLAEIMLRHANVLNAQFFDGSDVNAIEMLGHLYNYIAGLSNICPSFRMELGKCGFLSFLLGFLEDVKQESSASLWIESLLPSVLTILNNLSQAPQLKCEFQNNDAQQILPYYLEAPEVATDALLCLAKVMNDNDEASQLVEDTGMIHALLNLCSRAMSSDKLAVQASELKVYHLVDFLVGLLCLAENDVNKYKIMEHDAIVLLEKLLKNEKILVQSLGVDLLWTLSFELNARQEIKAHHDDIIAPLHVLIDSPSPELKLNATRAYDFLQHWDRLQQEAVEKAPNNNDDAELKRRSLYISYSLAQEKTVHRIKKDLESHGIEVAMEPDKVHGSMLEEAAKEIADAPLFLLCFSQNYKVNNFGRAEASYAYALDKPILSVRLEENYVPDGWLGFLVGLGYNTVDVLPQVQAFEACFNRLLAEIEAIFAKIFSGKKDPSLATNGGNRLKMPLNTITEEERSLSADSVSMRHQVQSVHSTNSSKVVTNSTNSASRTVDDGHLLPPVNKWTALDKRRWLITEHLYEVFASKMEDFDGERLWMLLEIERKAPEYFHNVVTRHFNESLPNMLRLFAALKRLSATQQFRPDESGTVLKKLL